MHLAQPAQRLPSPPTTMSISAVTNLTASQAIFNQIAARNVAPRNKPAGSEKESARSNDALRAARQAGSGAGSSHSEKSEVRLRTYA
jgi:hypothetical protein